MSASVRAYPTIALVGRHETPGIAEPLGRLAAFLVARGHRVLIDAETAKFTPLPGYPTAPTIELAAQASTLRSSSAATAPCWRSRANSHLSVCR